MLHLSKRASTPGVMKFIILIDPSSVTITTCTHLVCLNHDIFGHKHNEYEYRRMSLSVFALGGFYSSMF